MKLDVCREITDLCVVANTIFKVGHSFFECGLAWSGLVKVCGFDFAV